tara:strand:- start:4219 stop:4695 length:477 start_codon:yes stop_codon:yes gene_type:complete
MHIEGVKIFNADMFTDHRGDICTLWNSKNIDIPFNHDKICTSRKNVLRGIHGDFKSTKLVSCLYGELYFVIVDNRPQSKTYKQSINMILDDKSRKSILLPPGVGNGFYVLSHKSVFHYKWSYKGEYPDVKDQFTLKWNDPELNIYWPTNNPILSKRDK